LVRCLREGKSVTAVDGLSYRQGDVVIHSPDRAMIQCLDDLPFPARSRVLFPERYDQGNWGDLVASRGCPWDCSFCSAKALWGKPRFRSPLNVITEIDSIIGTFGTREFFFHDDTFTSAKKWTMEFCENLIAEKVRIIWVVTTRVDRLDREIIRLMKKAGCWKLFLGIESGSDRILQSVNKGITVRKIMEATQLLDREHVLYDAFFMGGFPDETEEDLQQTLRLMQSIHSSTIIFSIFQPLPGSRLHAELESYGLPAGSAGIDDISYFTPDHYSIRAMSRESFDRLLKEIVHFRDRHNSRRSKAFIRKLRFSQAMLTHCPIQFLGRIIGSFSHRNNSPL
jgi:anaerobic magnesium-protoporphyrin IX monomethyl ester cyclase